MDRSLRKLCFFFGLNVWGGGLLLGFGAIQQSNPSAWLLPVCLLFIGTLLLSKATFSVTTYVDEANTSH